MSEWRLRRVAWGSATLAVCLVGGLLIGTTRGVSDGNELRIGDSQRLSDLVRAAQADTEDLANTRDDLAAQVAQVQARVAATDDDVAFVLDELASVADPAGQTALRGPGVTVTLTDASRDADGKYPSGASPDDLVVHQQDVQSVLNAMWAGGAEAISMQDQRIVATSAPRCIGNTLLLHGRTYSPPYVITALGDPSRLETALDAEPGIRLYKQYATRYGLGYTQTSGDDMSVPAYTGGAPTR
ncbi:DUF881 domain-containing protein [Rhodococcus coprophilus]|uniref:Membrane protein n=1 Tax=Rhodococcus coprophilus TaxID=38310 RepID=A0A2X4U385_9NOCA|nr:DUF881 domain-containing protein [Rhodococcus coprophilus]MBM7458793.1 uncharacterized protein YlxW (UPF0749 family) [Rhodococcus coprophilus]SQI33511.1 membrane protein [Rhodococcus coprophilus]